MYRSIEVKKNIKFIKYITYNALLVRVAVYLLYLKHTNQVTKLAGMYLFDVLKICNTQSYCLLGVCCT
jgi:hypothetical protein